MPRQIPFVLVDLATVIIWANELLSTVFQVLGELRFVLERTIAARVWAVESMLNFNHRQILNGAGRIHGKILEK